MMTPEVERKRRLDRLLHAALHRAEGDREGFLRRRCARQPELLAAALDLLHASQVEDDFLAPGSLHGGQLLTRASEDLERGSLGPGDSVGPYRLLHEIGRGGMAIVYLAERADGQFERRLALKLMKLGAGGPEALRRFEQERRILASLEHPNIARLYDGGLAPDGRPFFVMEHVEGEPIDRSCDRRRLTVRRRLELFVRVASAVQHAHSALVVHRDIKPSNIVVTEDGEARLLDFGIAKLLEPARLGAEVPRTQTLHVVATPEYSSPEQVDGGSTTTASDVYQLGLLLDELLCGRRVQAVGGGSLSEIRELVCRRRPTPPSQTLEPVNDGARRIADLRSTTPDRLRRELAGDLDTIVSKALEKAPGDRYGSAADLAQDVRRYLEGLPIVARAPSLGYRGAKFVRRHALGVSVALLFALSLLAGFASTLWQARVAARERDRARQEAAAAAQVSEFLLETFQLADPREARGREVTAFELLERGAARIRRTLGTQPAIEAQLLEVMGRAYRGLGRHREASPLLERSLELRRRVLGHEHPAVAASLGHLGWLASDAGDFDAAEGHFRAALDVWRSLGGSRENTAGLAGGQSDLAWLLHVRGRHDQAQVLYEAAAAALRRLGTAHRPQLGTTLKSLGLLFLERGELQRCAPLLEEALALRRAALGPDHPDIADSLNALGMCFDNLGRPIEAEQAHRQALALRRRVLGRDHPLTSQSLNNLGALLFGIGDAAGARALFEESLELTRQRLGERHPRVATITANLGVLAALEGDAVSAEHLYRQALEIRREVHGDEHRGVASTLHSLGKLLKEEARLDEARDTLRQALAILDRVSTADDPARIAPLIDLVEVEVDRGELAAADHHLDEALALTTRLDAGDPRHVDAAAARAFLLAARGRRQEALEVLGQALERGEAIEAGQRRIERLQRRLSALRAGPADPRRDTP